MIEFKREHFKKYPEITAIYEIIKKKHNVASHTREVLFKNRRVKNFCEEARHFVLMDLKPPIYLHYDVSSWYHNKDGVLIKIESIGIYDNFKEYESTRLRSLHASPGSDGVFLN